MGIVINKVETSKNTKAFKMNTKNKHKNKIQLGWASDFVKIEEDAFTPMEMVGTKLEKAPKSL